MTRRKKQIKKIDSVTARQVAFSKRRKGLFKKAHELSTLCDAEIAPLVFSSTGKLFDYASSSIQQEIEWYDQHSAIQIQGDENELHKAVVAEKTRELRQLNDEELQGCTLEELQTLEERLERGLSRVSKTKDERILKQINALKRKGIQLKEENQRMKQSLVHGQGQSSESIIICSSSDINPPQDSDSSDTSLRLGQLISLSTLL
ncbi:MADS-box protein JOINTLESS-like isoform X2 [Prosopis cineraria]|uniref:MADS-box protein JOINTLESS-like isoform X2 n=1 Tax=Prosopis cineraria TaxID=364024 RepID=UPI00240F0D58|nr:MADS-box protein JOINTLESS-like isoform X2 [Prosopis cineraria]